MRVLPGIIGKLVEMSPYDKELKCAQDATRGQARLPDLRVVPTCQFPQILEALPWGVVQSTLVSSGSGRRACHRSCDTPMQFSALVAYALLVEFESGFTRRSPLSFHSLFGATNQMSGEQSAASQTPSVAIAKTASSRKAREDSVSSMETDDYVCVAPSTPFPKQLKS